MKQTESTGLANGGLHEKTRAAGDYVAAALDLENLKDTVGDALDAAAFEARHMARQGKDTAEELFYEARHLIRKNPWQAVGYALGAGLGLGVLAGWLVTRTAHTCRRSQASNN